MKRDGWLLLGFVVLALALRLFTLGDRPFDGDEGVIAQIASQPLSDLFRQAGRDVHPPLFHLLVSGSVGLFGMHEWSVRLVGVLAGALLVGLAPALGRIFKLDWRILALVLATSPYLVNLSQDARMYSLVVLLATSELVAIAALVESSSRSRWAWGGVVLGALALVYTHHIGWLILGLYAAVLLVWHRQFLAERLRLVLGSLGLLLLGYLPQLGTTLAQVQGRLAEQSTGAGLGETAKGTLGALYRMVAGRTFLDLSPGSLGELATTQPLLAAAFAVTLVVPLGLLAYGLVDRVRASWRPESRLVIGASLLVALLVGTVGTQASRYLAYLAPLILAFVVIAMAKSWPTSWGKVGAGLMAMIVLAGLGTQYVRHNQSAGVDRYAAVVRERTKPGDVVLVRGAFAGGESWAYQFYSQAAVPVVDLYADYDVRSSNLDELRSIDPATVAAGLLDQYARVWYFDNTYANPTLTTLPDGFAVETVPLFESDKEQMPLILTLVTKEDA